MQFLEMIFVLSTSIPAIGGDEMARPRPRAQSAQASHVAKKQGIQEFMVARFKNLPGGEQ